MNISDKGLAVLKLREGSRNKAYKDVKGVWTIGVGHTGPEVQEGLVWTDQQILDVLKQDVKVAEQGLTDNVRVALSQNQFDALVSFIFNVGVKAFRRSTMLKYINVGEFGLAAQQFDRWVIPVEVTSRRMSEKAQFQEV